MRLCSDSRTYAEALVLAFPAYSACGAPEGAFADGGQEPDLGIEYPLVFKGNLEILISKSGTP